MQPIEQLMFECRWLHQVHHWPPRPEDIPVVDWLALLHMGQKSLERIMAMPVLLHDPAKKQKCKELCMQELIHTYRMHRKTKPTYAYDEDSDTQALEILRKQLRYDELCDDDDHSSDTMSRINDQQSSTSSSVESSTGKVSEELWSRLKYWRERLVGKSFPWTATWLGVVFADLVLQGRSNRWPGLLKYMYQLSHTNPHMLPIHDGHSAMINNPNHIPNTNPP